MTGEVLAPTGEALAPTGEAPAPPTGLVGAAPASRSRWTRWPWMCVGLWVVGVVTAAAAIFSTGCSRGTARAISAGQLTREKGWVLVQGVTMVRQTADRDCGAAALSMMLQRWSTPSTPDEILRSVPMDPVHGIAAGALRDFARARGLSAFIVKGELTDLANEVASNRPVLVGLVQRQGERAFSHYEVVAGINPPQRQVLLLDPARGMREDGFDGFAAEWNGAGRLALVIVPP